MPFPHPPTPPGPPRILGGVFGIVFGGIGLTVIGFLWTERGFGEPPVFFKIFGSLIALAFVAMGATFLMAALKGPHPQPGPTAGEPPASASTAGTGYTCPACGARLGEAAEVSPKGDVKCGYCRQWFNIHG
jgi:DNA-directed RNA polymerase subunit RPC12/RpoP